MKTDNALSLLAALEELLAWMEENSMTHTPSVGVGVFKTEPVEYSVVTEARNAIKLAKGE